VKKNKIFSIQNNKKNQLLKNLILAQNHLGFPIQKTVSNSLNYLYNKRLDHTIINLNQTIKSLQRVFLFIKRQYMRTKLKYNSILFIFEIPKIDIYFLSFFSDSFLYETQKKHKGFITNSNYENLPELIIILNSKVNNTLINEAALANIPVISLLDTNADPNLVTFPILTNKQNVKSIFFILYLFMEFFHKNNMYPTNAITKN